MGESLFQATDDTSRKSCPNLKKREYRAMENLWKPRAQNAVGQDTLKDPILSKEAKETILFGRIKRQCQVNLKTKANTLKMKSHP